MLRRLLITLVAISCLPAMVFSAGLEEGEIKAGFVLNFLRLTTFQAGDTTEPPLNFCFFGPKEESAPFGELEGESVLGRELKVHFEDWPRCDAAFLTKSADASDEKAFEEQTSSTETLQIVDTPEQFERWGILLFFTESNRIRFRVHMARLRASELRLSSKLLSLAEINE